MTNPHRSGEDKFRVLSRKNALLAIHIKNDKSVKIPKSQGSAQVLQSAVETGISEARRERQRFSVSSFGSLITKDLSFFNIATVRRNIHC